MWLQILWNMNCLLLSQQLDGLNSDGTEIRVLKVEGIRLPLKKKKKNPNVEGLLIKSNGIGINKLNKRDNIHVLMLFYDFISF